MKHAVRWLNLSALSCLIALASISSFRASAGQASAGASAQSASPSVEHRYYVGYRHYLNANGSILFSSPQALLIEIDRGQRRVFERLTNPGEIGRKEVGKELIPRVNAPDASDPMNAHVFDIRFQGISGSGTAEFTETPETWVWGAYSSWSGKQWSWSFDIDADAPRVSGGGKFTSEGIETFGVLQAANGKTVTRYSEKFREASEEEYERVRAAILADEIPEIAE